ncbi:hypothetical protein NHE_0103 [Neorickettsia helminthoeca str. Oregon]|uniref:Uncharacterized protein n=1 Tax=Neorickettsia helminthoeca str. Oregon TaxID=1286528 RepID=X5H323_9RICK|nr:hypothetical protein [Neorickettsia helminthoeca]AHX11073.1 hypothetical protein NHE_0103 [Neorickettsia helminthoeca str. Oregon]
MTGDTILTATGDEGSGGGSLTSTLVGALSSVTSPGSSTVPGAASPTSATTTSATTPYDTTSDPGGGNSHTLALVFVCAFIFLFLACLWKCHRNRCIQGAGRCASECLSAVEEGRGGSGTRPRDRRSSGDDRNGDSGPAPDTPLFTLRDPGATQGARRHRESRY